MLQLLLPFVLGHLSRPWIGDWVAKHKKWKMCIRDRYTTSKKAETDHEIRNSAWPIRLIPIK